ncbi:MAG: YbaB/EbfC family nucleoid-associated protein [candidate division WWE3 bacterium]|nr:YbaB/EbfC family nucleoid-associated protein [candidate division WWE3 bacterium]
MFEQVKKLNELRKQGQRLKSEMERITVEVSEGKVKIVIRGDQQIERVEVDGQEREDLKKAFNKAVKESQKVVSKKLSGMLMDMKLPNP